MFDLGQRIKYLRKQSSFTQAQLTKKLNKSKSAICRYESGEKEPSLDTLIDIATLFNVSLDYLVGLEKKDVLSIEKLTSNQVSILNTLLIEFRSAKNYQKVKLTERQLDIFNELISEFLR